MYFPGIDHSFVGKTGEDTRRASLAGANPRPRSFYHALLALIPAKSESPSYPRQELHYFQV